MPLRLHSDDPAHADDPDRAGRIRLLICLLVAVFVCLAGALLLVRWLKPWQRPVLPGRAPQLRADASPVCTRVLQ